MSRTRRVIRLEPGQQVSAGEHVALVECYGPAGRWNEVTTDPRTNQSGAVRWAGWLGTTNDVSRHASGPWRVVSVEPWEVSSDPSGDYVRASLARIAPPADGAS